jgi:hypothetical protein
LPAGALEVGSRKEFGRAFDMPVHMGAGGERDPGVGVRARFVGAPEAAAKFGLIGENVDLQTD